MTMTLKRGCELMHFKDIKKHLTLREKYLSLARTILRCLCGSPKNRIKVWQDYQDTKRWLSKFRFHQMDLISFQLRLTNRSSCGTARQANSFRPLEDTLDQSTRLHGLLTPGYSLVVQKTLLLKYGMYRLRSWCLTFQATLMKYTQLIGVQTVSAYAQVVRTEDSESGATDFN